MLRSGVWSIAAEARGQWGSNSGPLACQSRVITAGPRGDQSRYQDRKGRLRPVASPTRRCIRSARALHRFPLCDPWHVIWDLRPPSVTPRTLSMWCRDTLGPRPALALAPEFCLTPQHLLEGRGGGANGSSYPDFIVGKMKFTKC